MRTVRWVFAGILSVSGFYTLLVALHSAGLLDLPAAANVGFTVVLTSGYAAVCWLRAALVPGDRLAWALIGGGLAGYAAGSVLWQAIYLHRDPPPYPSVSDLLWLALVPLAVAGIWLMVRARLGRRNSSLLDGLVAGLGAASVAALLWLPQLTEGAGDSWATNVVNFAYPLVDLALAASAIGAMAVLGAWRRPAWLLLSGGFLVFTAADIWFLILVLGDTFHEGEWNDLAYLLAIAMIASAALLPEAPPRPEQAPAPRRYEFDPERGNGVQTAQELAWLQEGDCDLIQGYLTSRPLSAADLHTWLDREPALPVAAVAAGTGTPGVTTGAGLAQVSAPPDQ